MVTAIIVGFGLIVSVAVLQRLAPLLGLMDFPDERKLHDGPIAAIGGVAIFICLITFSVIGELPLVLSNLVMASGIIVAIGALDDSVGVAVIPRLIIQAVAALVMIAWSGLWVHSIGLEFLNLDSLNVYLGIPITVFAIVGLTNGFNMIDGIDGLASGHALISLCTVAATLFAVNGSIGEFDWLFVLVSILFPFWLVNMSFTPLRRVFLGDSGSLLLGFLVGWTLIYLTQKPVALLHPVAALWCVTIPVVDTLIVIARRVKNKCSPFSPDRTHLHHICIDNGMGHKIVLILILSFSTLINAAGIWVTYAISPLVSLHLYVLLLIGFGYGMLQPNISKYLH